MKPDSPLVEIRNATIWRGTTCVFEHLDLTIEQHERVAIVGPNGSGKTTLLKAINRELYPVAKPDSVFQILGHDTWNVWELRKHIGVVSQDLQQRYTPSTTALEVVISGFHSSIGVHGTLADRVDNRQIAAARATLDDLGIGALARSELCSCHQDDGVWLRIHRAHAGSSDANVEPSVQRPSPKPCSSPP